MITEDEWDQNLEQLFYGANMAYLKTSLAFQACMEETQELDNLQVHYNLKMDLVEHLWAQSHLNIGWNKI